MKNILAGVLLASLSTASAFAAQQPIFTLRSPDFTSGHAMPKASGGNLPNVAACKGQNISPALAWKDAPAGTKSFALIIADAQGRNGLGITHLLAYGIPGTASGMDRTALAEGRGFTGGKNSFGRDAYNGPCPPANADTHFYTFTLIATDMPANSLPAGLDTEALFDHLNGHTLGAAGIIGTFSGKQ